MCFGGVYTNINLNHYTMKNVPLFKGSLSYYLCLFLFFNLSCSSDDEISDIPIDDTFNEGPTAATAPMILPDVHDPSQLLLIDDHLVFFASAVEWNVFSLENRTWTLGGDDIYPQGKPQWYEGEDNYWAPGFVDLGSGLRRVYHSAVEDEDNHQSKIGFVEVNGNVVDGFSFEPSGDFVLSSYSLSDAFAIDPSVFMDKENKTWMVYGSHAAGIYNVELDAQTGLLKENPEDKAFNVSDSRFVHLANYGGSLDENNIEAAYIYNHPESEYYYLFVNWDVCCSGVTSTYNIRIGRSESPTGPFIDREGNDMAEGGGSLFLDAYGDIVGDSRFIGPGHSGIYRHSDGTYYFSHHFYDGANDGQPSFAIWPMSWENDWPKINPEAELSF